jgi:hypothetical protein
MDIYIELLVGMVIVIMLVGWAWWFNYSRKRALKKYNPNDDKSKNGEEVRRARLEGGKLKVTSASDGAPRPSQPEPRELLPAASASNAGKNSKRAGKGLFRRISRRKK